MEDLVTITSFADERAANEAKTLLDRCGIAASIRRARQTRRPELRLIVLHEDAMEAAGLLGITG